MRVVVRFEESSRAALARWRLTLAPDAVAQAALAGVYMDELKKRLIAFGGFPSGSLVIPGTTPLLHWAELAGNMWVSYIIEDSGRLFRRSRTIRVIECEPLPPSSAIPASPPT